MGSESSGLHFPIVGIGASAGGLEPISQLLNGLPPDTGMAYVVVSHLSPAHESALATILSRFTVLPVADVSDSLAPEPDHVYVIPPGSSLTLEDGRFRLTPRDTSPGKHHTIDRFFESLAAEVGHRAIGVVLSGSATDGTIGLEEIKAKGGLAFAQDESAQYESMPRSAVSSGAVDFVLPPGAIAKEIGELSRRDWKEMSASVRSGAERSALTGVLRTLRNETGVDFAHYKETTLHRRIIRRMVLRKADGLEDYLRILRAEPAELQALFQDILINVTSFFRNPEGYDVLTRTVFPRLIDNRASHDPLRLWVVGCSSGEEAYSLAILITEYLEKAGKIVPLQIFATDLNPAAIEKARSGFYSAAKVEAVSPERLRRFFPEADGGYRVAKQIRDMCIFAQHDVIADPPFSRMDLITCRNLLIYLDATMQQRVIPLLHYGLKGNGFLWLGSSETVGHFADHFNTEDPRQRLYSRKGGLSRTTPTFPTDRAFELSVAQATARSARDIGGPTVDAQREADRILLGRFAPPAALINGDYEILQFRGDTSPFLAPAPGRASLNLLKMLREGLMVAVNGALARAGRTKLPAREPGGRVRHDSGFTDVSVEVIPVKGPAPQEDCFLVVFEEAPAAQQGSDVDVSIAPHNDESRQQVVQLTQELKTTREYLQSLVEQQEASNEELQSANEEVQSANEELQSINEELETSKEEIQSSNEELATLNDELVTRNNDLARSNNDFVNLLASVQLPIVMLDTNLRIRRITPPAERLLNLLPTDVGRPIADVRMNMDLPDLQREIVTVIDTITPHQRDVQDRAGRWYSLRIRPYRTTENRIEGAVIVLVDIDSMKRSGDELRESEHRFRVLADSAPVNIWVNDQTGRVFANRAYCEFLGVAEAEVQGSGWLNFVHPDDREKYLAVFNDAVRRKVPYEAHLRLRRVDGHYRWMKSVGRPRAVATGEAGGFVGCSIDITDLKEAEEGLRRADRSKNEFLAVLAHELRNPLAPLRNAAELLRVSDSDPEELHWVSSMVERQISHLSRLVDDLLDVSRITRGKIQLSRRRMDLGDAITGALESYGKAFAERSQTLTTNLHEDRLILDADPVRIDQILGNLLSNAAKFTPKAGRIHVTTTVVYDGGPAMAEIRVGDNGEGISSKALPAIFDMFVQEDRSLERTQGGLGIGLTLVRSLVEMHGGTIEAHSAGIGQGSEFVVRLPLAVVEPDRNAPDPTSERQGESPPDDSPRRIMVVDDNVDAANSLARALRRAHHEVLVVHDGRAAIDLADEVHPEVVLLDIGMPGMSGLAVARELRQMGGPEVPLLVAITGYGSDDVRQATNMAGFDHHFTKPMNIGKLRGILRDAEVRRKH